jgi:hypothetical protein
MHDVNNFGYYSEETKTEKLAAVAEFGIEAYATGAVASRLRRVAGLAAETGVAEGAEVAKSVGVLDNAAFAQKTFSQTFSSDGKFAGQTIDDVARSLRSGVLKPADVPIEYIIRDGNTLMLNTRSAQALQQAGIPRAQWNAVNMTGNAAAEARLTGQLQRNGLDSTGILNPKPGRRKSLIRSDPYTQFPFPRPTLRRKRFWIVRESLRLSGMPTKLMSESVVLV